MGFVHSTALTLVSTDLDELTHRGKMNYDPVVFALTDRISQVVGVISAAIIAMATINFGKKKQCSMCLKSNRIYRVSCPM